MKENAIEWLTGDQVATVTLSQKKYISQVMKIAERMPEAVEIIERPENNNGYLVAHVAVDRVFLKPKPRISDEARKSSTERLKRLRVSKNATKQWGARHD